MSPTKKGNDMGVSTASPLVSKNKLAILQARHVTAAVTTSSGSRYTVVTRPNVGVVLIHDTKGWAIKGPGTIKVTDGRMFVFDKDGKVVAQTTAITSIYVMSN